VKNYQGVVTSIETIMDECLIIYKNKKADQAKECLEHILNLTYSIDKWFHKKERTRALMDKFQNLMIFSLLLNH